MELVVTTRSSSDGGDLVEVRVLGALDLASRDAFLDVAVSAFPAATRLHVNAAGIDFIDSTGIAALVRVARVAEDRGVQFAVVDRSPRLERVLQLTGLSSEWQPRDPAARSSPVRTTRITPLSRASACSGTH